MTPRTAITANKIPTATPAAIDVSFPRCFGLKLLTCSKIISQKEYSSEKFLVWTFKEIHSKIRRSLLYVVNFASCDLLPLISC